jgi:hypothetical protein
MHRALLGLGLAGKELLILAGFQELTVEGDQYLVYARHDTALLSLVLEILEEVDEHANKWMTSTLHADVF